MVATINSTKHYIQHSPTSTTAGNVLTLDEANAVALSAVTNANDVRAGCVIKAIYVELWVSSTSGPEPASFNITVEKTKGGQPDMTFVNSQNLMAYPNKANILYCTQGEVGDQTNNFVPLLKQWILIPKGKQRFASGDQFRINIASITEGLVTCGMSTYKEYY